MYSTRSTLTPAGRVDPTRYRGLIFPGHDEYWSAPMRTAVGEGASVALVSSGDAGIYAMAALVWVLLLSASAARRGQA